MIALLARQPLPVKIIWAVLAAEFAIAAIQGRILLAALVVATVGISLLPVFFASRFGLKLPTSFLVAITVFTFATIFLGEAYDFYERYWWWDILLHSGSAMGFGLLGFLFVFMLFEGDRYAAPPWAMAFFAFCFAVTIGTLWEIFEFAMDQNFGLNMQKSGLVDTMTDLIVDAIGAALGGATGFFYMKGKQLGGLTAPLSDFVRANRRFFRKSR